MSGMLQSVETESSVLVGKIELARAIERKVMSHDAIYLITHGLNCDYKHQSVIYHE